jgi:hypothetical protein
MDKADEHDACDEVRKWRRCGQQKPCGFAAALGRRQRVAHNSTGPTSVSIDFTTQKGSWGPAGGSIESTGARSVRQARRLGNTRRSSNTFSSCLSCSKASPRGVWRPSVMQFYSGPPIHFLSGVDKYNLIIKLSTFLFNQPLPPETDRGQDTQNEPTFDQIFNSLEDKQF